MTPLSAVQLIEESDLEQDDPLMIEAWQCLVDTGIAWQLQGWYGRTAAAMIERGMIAAQSGGGAS